MSSYTEGQVHQLANALEAAGFTADYLTKLGQYRALGDFRLVLDGRAEIRPTVAEVGACTPVPVVTKRKADLLERLGTVTVGPTAEPFVARKKLVVDTSPDVRVRISFVSNNVADWWLAGDGLVEEPMIERELVYQRLRKASVDDSIIAELGGVVPAKVSWTEVYETMAKQSNGSKAGAVALRTDGWWNLFYIPQVVTKLKGNAFSYVNRAGRTVIEEVSNADYLFEEDSQTLVLRAALVRWLDVGWDVYAYSVGSPLRWREVGLVFSRSSRVLESSDTVASA